VKESFTKKMRIRRKCEPCGDEGSSSELQKLPWLWRPRRAHQCEEEDVPIFVFPEHSNPTPAAKPALGTKIASCEPGRFLARVKIQQQVVM